MILIETKDCESCENLQWDDSWDAYICPLKTGINQYIGETKWQISGDENKTFCPLD